MFFLVWLLACCCPLGCLRVGMLACPLNGFEIGMISACCMPSVAHCFFFIGFTFLLPAGVANLRFFLVFQTKTCYRACCWHDRVMNFGCHLFAGGGAWQ